MRKRAYFATVGLQKTTGRLALPRHGGHKTRLKAKRGAAALYSCAARKTPLTEKNEYRRLTLHARKTVVRSRTAADL